MTALKENLKNKIIVNCPIHAVTFLRREVEELGFIVKSELPNGVELEGTLSDTIKLNFYLRTASKVLLQIETLTAKNVDELYEKLLKVEWENYIDENGYFSVTSFTDNATVNNTLITNLKCKDAIVDRFREKFNTRPDSGSDKKGAVIFLFWREESVTVYLDTSGETLTKHSYRKRPVLAPLQENLACALILATKWNRESHFVNPMCGSGTLAIEAAMLAADRPPGLLRSNYGFMHLKGFDEELYQQIRNDAKKKVKKNLPFNIIATDKDRQAIEAAKNNAMTAGVAHLIQFECCPFEKTYIPEGNGVVMINPPYGSRLGEEEKLLPLYKQMGDFLKQSCKGYTGYIFTGNPNLAKNIGLRTSRKFPFFNAKIECRLLEYELYEGSRKNRKDTIA